MILLIIVFFGFLASFVRSQIKDDISKLFAGSFLLYWFVTFAMSSFDPYGFNHVSFSTYLILFLNVSTFLFGFTSYHFCNKVADKDLDIEKLVKTKVYNLVVIIGIVFVISLVTTKQSVMAYNSYDTSLFRADFFEVLFQGNALLLYGYYLFLYPLYFFLMSVVAYCLFFYRDWKVILMALIYVVLFMSLSEGRLQYMNFALVLLFDFWLYRSRNKGFKIGKSVKIFGVMGVIGLYLMMAYTTQMRLSKNSFSEGVKELNETFVTYSIAPFRAFDYAMNNDYIEKAGGYKLGRASICGFDYLVSSLLKRVGIKYVSVRTETNDYLQNNAISIGADHTVNYSYTNAMYHYYDFGILGILIIPFIFGYFCRNVIHSFCNYNTIYLHAACTFLFFVVMHMVFSWYFNKLFAIPYLLFLMLKKK